MNGTIQSGKNKWCLRLPLNYVNIRSTECTDTNIIVLTFVFLTRSVSFNPSLRVGGYLNTLAVLLPSCLLHTNHQRPQRLLSRHRYCLPNGVLIYDSKSIHRGTYPTNVKPSLQIHAIKVQEYIIALWGIDTWGHTSSINRVYMYMKYQFFVPTLTSALNPLGYSLT